jgi:hypothetical protein
VVLAGDVASVPLVGLVPVQPPPAVHEVALVEDQVTVEMLPEVMLVGLAENATVGSVGPDEPKLSFMNASERTTPLQSKCEM